MDFLKKLAQLREEDYWKAIARSQVGTIHLREDPPSPCQDYGKYEQYGDYLVGAVSDGAGSCRFSQDGSKTTVDVTLQYLLGVLQDQSNTNPFANETEAKPHFLKIINLVREELHKKAESFSQEYSQEILFRDFSCTLLAFVVSPHGITAMQLGDGFIVIREQKEPEYKLLFVPQKGEFANETAFITSSPQTIKENLQITFLPTSISFVCASTDGLESLALDLGNKKASLGYFVPLETAIKKAKDPDQDLADYIHQRVLNSPEVNARTNDDKTILLCCRRQYARDDAIPNKPIAINLETGKSPVLAPSTPPGNPRDPEEIPGGKSSEVPEGGPSPRTKSNPPIRFVWYFLVISFFLLYFLGCFSSYYSQQAIINHPEWKIVIPMGFWKIQLGSFIGWFFGIIRVVFALICCGLSFNIYREFDSSQKKSIRIAKILSLILWFAPYILAWATVTPLIEISPVPPYETKVKVIDQPKSTKIPEPSTNKTPQEHSPSNKPK